MLPKQKYSKIPLVVTLKIEVKISLPHYARHFFMRGIKVLGCMNGISRIYIKNNSIEVLFYNRFTYMRTYLTECSQVAEAQKQAQIQKCLPKGNSRDKYYHFNSLFQEQYE